MASGLINITKDLSKHGDQKVQEAASSLLAFITEMQIDRWYILQSWMNQYVTILTFTRDWDQSVNHWHGREITRTTPQMVEILVNWQTCLLQYRSKTRIANLSFHVIFNLIANCVICIFIYPKFDVLIFYLSWETKVRFCTFDILCYSIGKPLWQAFDKISIWLYL